MKRNLMIFEAPEKMSEEVKQLAVDTYTNSSAVCRQAIAQYLNQRSLPENNENTRF